MVRPCYIKWVSSQNVIHHVLDDLLAIIRIFAEYIFIKVAGLRVIK